MHGPAHFQCSLKHLASTTRKLLLLLLICIKGELGDGEKWWNGNGYAHFVRVRRSLDCDQNKRAKRSHVPDVY